MIQIIDSDGFPIKGLFRDSRGVIHNLDDAAYAKYKMADKIARNRHEETVNLRKELDEVKEMLNQVLARLNG